MAPNDFKPGYLDYLVTHRATDFKAYHWDAWHDGFLAFSKGERRFDKVADPALIPALIEGKKQRTPDGFLMEMNLWGSSGDNVYKEIVLEREEDAFFIQEWTLWLGVPDGKSPNCYVAEAETGPPDSETDPNKAKKKYLFKTGELDSYEIICPDHRLHFFLTTGGTRR